MGGGPDGPPGPFVESGAGADQRSATGGAPAPASASERWFHRFGRCLGVVLVGYMLFDKAFAYLHIPGTPVYVGEMLIAVGAVAALASIGHLQALGRSTERIFLVLTAFALWGTVLFVPGLVDHGMDAARDFALCYYCVFALLVYAALARTPDLLERWTAQLTRLTPLILLWLPIDLLLASQAEQLPSVPFSQVSIVSFAPGNAAITALLLLGVMWLLPNSRSPRSRALWSVVAFGVIALAGTQNRAGLLAAVAGAVIGLSYHHGRKRLLKQAAAVGVIGLALAAMIPDTSYGGTNGRTFSPAQLVNNLASLGADEGESSGDLGGTVRGRQELWTRVLDKQMADGLLVAGSGFGPNLASQVGVFDGGNGALRNPHNSHLDILARMGLIGISLWIVLWLAWYSRMIAGCRRLTRQGLHNRRQAAVVSMMMVTAFLVSTFFAPQLEGPQVAIPLWIAFGVGMAMTSTRPCFDRISPARSMAMTHSQGPRPSITFRPSSIER